ncbi:MAG: Rpn family recombination-promoting nuclease/putative transposase [Bacteroidales bacterium]|nr:Rpn family recombination-promoting nuclease/putative transposase [Bacteroidales bacterium]
MTPYKYFSPVTDVTFRKVFGEHIDLAASLLNAFLPLENGRVITNIQYVPPEMMPDNPLRKNSIVDVRCEDSSGSIFLVEMQLNWDTDFMQRVVFNTSKAYVKQLDKGKPFHLLQPVYSLNFVQGDLHKGLSEWYHPYQLVHIYHSDRVFDGLKIVFSEMKKYENLTVKGNSKKDLWMRFFTEMTEKTRKPAPELLADPEVAKAIELLEMINYNDAEQELYDRYWDAISVEATWISIGQRKGEKIGMRQGVANTKRLLVLNMLANGLEPSMVAKIAELTEEEVRKMAQKL